MTAFAWLIVLPLVASPVVYLIGQWGNKNNYPHAARQVGLIVLLVTWLPFILTASDFAANGPAILTVGGQSLQLDGVSLLLAALSLGLGTLVTLYSAEYMGADEGQEKFYSMLVMMIGVMMGLGCATDLFNLWLWFEGMAISSYLLVAFYRTEKGALEAGVKYLVQSAVGSVFVLLGITVVLAQTGTLNLTEVSAQATLSPAFMAAGALFLIGFGVKVAMVPMHTWLPDAHSQAPSGISAMLSGVVIEAGLIAMLRALSGLAGMAVSWGVLLMGFGALNMLVGNLMALRQQQIKRLLAYSSLSHVGYMLIGLGVGVYGGEAAGLEGGVFHMLTHGLMKGLAFLAAGALLWALHVARHDHSPLTRDDLRGASKRYPLTAFALSVAVLALGGLPPLAGFMSKWQIFQAGALLQDGLVLFVVVFAGLNSVLSLAYYAPLVNLIYRKEPSEAVMEGLAVPTSMSIPMVLLLLAVVVIGFWPGLMSWLTGPAGASLLAAFGG